MEQELTHEIRRLVADLVAGRYADVVADGRGGRLTEVELATAIAEYGHVLVPLPDAGLELIDVYQHESTDACSVEVPLWTAEEGRSDLTLSLTATRQIGR